MGLVKNFLQPVVNAAWAFGGYSDPVAAGKSIENPATTLADAAPWLLEAYGNTSSGGIAVSEKSAMTLTAVWGACRLIGGLMATFDLNVERRIDTEENGSYWVPDAGHPVQAILDNPNPIFSPFMMTECLTEGVLKRGNGYAAIGRLNSFRPSSLTPLQPMNVPEVRRVGDRLKYKIRYTDESGFKARVFEEILDQDFIIHFAGPGFDGVQSPSPITHAAREAIGLGLALQEFQQRYLTGGARPSGVLALEPGIGGDDYAKLKAEWNAAYGGLSKAGKTAVLPAGATYSPISFTHEDAEIILTRKFSVAEIGRVYGIPLHLLGETEKSTSHGTGLEEQTASFVRFTLEPQLGRQEHEYTRKLFREDERGRYRVRFDRTAIMRGTGKALAAFVETLVQKAAVMRPNEGRRVLGMPPTDDPKDNELREPTGAPKQSEGNQNDDD